MLAFQPLTMTDSTRKKLNGALQVWEWSPRQLNFLKERLSPSMAAKLEYVPMWSSTDADSRTCVDILDEPWCRRVEGSDVLFFGFLSESRKQLCKLVDLEMSLLRQSGVAASHDCVSGIFGRELQCKICKAKVIYNEHSREGAVLELHRINPLLMFGKAVVTSSSADKVLDESYRSAVRVVKPIDIPHEISKLLMNDTARHHLEWDAFSFAQNMKPKAQTQVCRALSSIASIAIAGNIPSRREGLQNYRSYSWARRMSGNSSNSSDSSNGSNSNNVTSLTSTPAPTPVPISAPAPAFSPTPMPTPTPMPAPAGTPAPISVPTGTPAPTLAPSLDKDPSPSPPSTPFPSPSPSSDTMKKLLKFEGLATLLVPDASDFCANRYATTAFTLALTKTAGIEAFFTGSSSQASLINATCMVSGRRLHPARKLQGSSARMKYEIRMLVTKYEASKTASIVLDSLRKVRRNTLQATIMRELQKLNPAATLRFIQVSALAPIQVTVIDAASGLPDEGILSSIANLSPTPTPAPTLTATAVVLEDGSIQNSKAIGAILITFAMLFGW